MAGQVCAHKSRIEQAYNTWQNAEVPLAELSNFTTFIRQTTQGRGWFTTEFARYEILPEMLVPAVVEQAKKLGNLDEGAED